MFGAGYAAAEDRLFFIDVLRHARPRASCRASPAARRNRGDGRRAVGGRALHRGRPPAPVRPRRRPLRRPRAPARRTTRNYVAGINQYIAEARLDPTKMPGEYAAIGRPQGPDDWKVTDLFATASLVGGIFGKGGGRELAEVPAAGRVQGALRRQEGPHAVASSSRAFDDPDAPTTVQGQALPVPDAAQAARAGRRGAARPRLVQGARGLGSSTARQRPAACCRRQPAAASPRAGRHAPGARRCRASLGGLPASSARCPRRCPTRCSSRAPTRPAGTRWRSSARRSAYFAPQILMEEDLHGPGHRRPGRRLPRREPLRPARPRPRLRLERHLGRPGHHRHLRGAAVRRDALPLPRPVPADRGARPQERVDAEPRPTRRRPARRRCTPSARSSASSPAAAPTRASRCSSRCCARPTCTRSTRPSASATFNDARARSARRRTSSARPSNIGYTFNWFYIDAKHIAYFNSGNNPVRAKGTTGQLPMAVDQGVARLQPGPQHGALHAVRPAPAGRRPAGLTSWNNRQAPGYAGADSNLFSSVFRSQMLDRQLALRLEGRPQAHAARDGRRDGAGGHHRPARHDVACRSRCASLGQAEGPRAAPRPWPSCKAWSAGGAHRIDRNRDGVYDDADAVRIMDAWWPRLVQAMFQPVMGKRRCSTGSRRPTRSTTRPTTTATTSARPTRRASTATCSRTSSASLKRPVAQKYAAAFCGRGRLAACRKALQASLKSALGEKSTDTYPADDVCKAGDQACLDTVRFRPLGGVTQPLIPWINRPTYQQAVEVQGTAAAVSGRTSRPAAGSIRPGSTGRSVAATWWMSSSLGRASRPKTSCW